MSFYICYNVKNVEKQTNHCITRFLVRRSGVGFRRIEQEQKLELMVKTYQADF